MLAVPPYSLRGSRHLVLHGQCAPKRRQSTLVDSYSLKCGCFWKLAQKRVALPLLPDLTTSFALLNSATWVPAAYRSPALRRVAIKSPQSLATYQKEQREMRAFKNISVHRQQLPRIRSAAPNVSEKLVGTRTKFSLSLEDPHRKRRRPVSHVADYGPMQTPEYPCPKRRRPYSHVAGHRPMQTSLEGVSTVIAADPRNANLLRRLMAAANRLEDSPTQLELSQHPEKWRLEVAQVDKQGLDMQVQQQAASSDGPIFETAPDVLQAAIADDVAHDPPHAQQRSTPARPYDVRPTPASFHGHGSMLPTGVYPDNASY